MIISPPYPLATDLSTSIQDPTGSHTKLLGEITVIRAKLKISIKAENWITGSQLSFEYLPLLLTLMRSLDLDELIVTSDSTWTCKSSISAQPLLKKSSKATISSQSINFELLSTLVCYSICLANQANLSTSSLDVMDGLSIQERNEKQEKNFSKAADTLCTAAGILVFCSQTVVPNFESDNGPEVKKVEIEFTKDGILALSKIYLAQANILAIKKLLCKAKGFNIYSGPPLSPSHPSASLLSKLYIHVVDLIAEARILSNSRFNQSIRDFIDSTENSSLAMAYKWIGIDIGEKGRIEFSSSITFLKMSRNQLLNGKKFDGMVEELEIIKAFQSGYEKINNTLYFQALPYADSVKIPAGVKALGINLFNLPACNLSPSQSLHVPIDTTATNYPPYVGQGAYF